MSGCDFPILVINFVLIVELQKRFFILLVMVKFHVRIMFLNIIFILSILFVSFVSLSVKLYPFYGGLTLVISSEIGCLIFLSQGGHF